MATRTATLLRAVLLAAALALTAAPAFAHRVNIFAWLEGAEIRGNCAFSRNSPVRNGRITVYSALDGKELLAGLTDNEGNFSFPVPERAGESGLRIRINAGEGHENEWLMEAREFAQVSATTGEIAVAPPDRAAPPPTATAGELVGGLGPEEVRRIVAEVMDAKLTPLRRDLASLANPEPGLREIVGGLGWLVGLAGLLLYFRGRRRA